MFTDDIERIRTQAHDANVANKIIDSLKGLQQSSDEKSRCRWVWELIQNAKDVTNSSGGVDIRISLDKQSGKLRFAHNGKPFTMQNIVFLIEQVSTKDRDEKEGIEKSTGKFGTGFLTTHLLSDVVTLSGTLVDGDNRFRKFQLDIDRSEKTKEGIIDGNKKSFEQLQKSIESGEVVYNYNEDLFNTSFTYSIDQKGLEVAKEGLDNLYVALPYVFAFVPEVRSVYIDECAWKFTRGEFHESSNIKVQKIIIEEGSKKRNTYIATVQGENITIAIENKKDGNHVAIKEFADQLPRIFCDFPLIGTEDFAFPVVVNSFHFNPTEPRNGIFLKDVEEIETNDNKNLMIEAVQLYGEFLKNISYKGWKNIYNIVKVRTQKEKVWLSTEWVGKYITNECKKIIEKVPVIDNAVGERVALLDDWEEINIWIIQDSDEKMRAEIWKLVSQLMPNMVTQYSEINEWYSSLWKDCNKFTLRSLIENVQKFASMNVLKENLHINGEEWLNQLYTLIAKTRGAIDYIKNSQIRIFPNQNGDFCSLNELSVDVGVDEVYKDILNFVQSDCRNILLSKEIVAQDWMDVPRYSIQDIFTDILKGISIHPEKKEDVYRRAVVLCTKGETETCLEEKRRDILEFAATIFPGQLSNDVEVSAVSEELLEDSIKFICVQMADEVSQCGKLQRLELSFDFGAETVKNWIARFVDYVIKSEYDFLLDRKIKTILPNQNGEFRAKEELFLDSGDMDEILKDISEAAGYDVRSEILLADVLLTLPDNRTKGIGDIAPYIVSYIKNNQGIAKTQDNKVIDTFKQFYHWVKDNSESARKHFKEICENIHWLYNDEEIAENMKKAEQINAVLERCHISDISVLENAYLKMTNSVGNVGSMCDYSEEKDEDLLIQYGIATQEQYEKAVDMNVFKNDFLYTSSHDIEKFNFANRILERAKNRIIDFLGKKPEYDVSNLIEVDKTVFIIEKNKEQIYLIARPSDYNYVAIYYDTERNVLDYNKDWELWVEDGVKAPEKITFGKMLKLTGINKIPLKQV